MRETDLYRSGKPLELLSRNCFELLVKSITALVTLRVEISGLGATSATVHTIENAGFESALVQWGCSATRTSRSARPRSSDHRQLWANCPARQMNCRLLLRRVASRGVLPRGRFSPLAPSSDWRMSAFPPLSGDEQTSGERGKMTAHDPEPTSPAVSPCDRS
jgi:hypothetical protein